MTEGLEIKGIKEVAQKIIEAAEKKEKVVIFGDADLDGIASVIILEETFKILNPGYSKKNLKIYFPDRENEGYGITISALNFFKKFKPTIFFALDCGISNFKEIDLAKKMGFYVIVIDHHQVLDKLPKADLIVDPKQPDDPYPFKQFSAAGIVYRLAKFTLIKAQKEWQPERFLELVALATLADQMPLIDENKKLVEEGISALNYTQRIGLKTLKELTKSTGQDLTDLFQNIIAPLNSSEKIGNFTESYLLLTTKSPRQAKLLANDLIKKCIQKREVIQRIIGEVEERIKQKESDIIFEGDSSWPLVVIGIVASKISQKYKKPTFLFKINQKESICSARLPNGLDGVEALASCKELLDTYGGHPPACGCRFRNENAEKLRDCLINYFSKKNNSQKRNQNS
jgi:single-stranded-DNA-specific exonuclease